MTPTPATVASAMGAADAGADPDRDILAIIAERGIAEVLHFTTNLGLIGTLGSGLLLSRSRLPQERYLEHVYRPNSSTRKDPAWLDFVNLSITRINDWMFDTSEGWHAHEDIWWAALAFDPVLLAEPGAVFVTTNNIYPAARRYQGAAGLQALFADPVIGRYATVHDRTGKSPAQPTDRQAEVLYPKAVPTALLRTIYVREPDHADAVAGIFGALPELEVPVVVAPEVFA